MSKIVCLHWLLLVFYLLFINVQFVLQIVFSERYRVSDWPNSSIPLFAAGVYAIWESDIFI